MNCNTSFGHNGVWPGVQHATALLLILVMLLSGCATLSPGTATLSSAPGEEAPVGPTDPSAGLQLKDLSNEDFETFIAGRKSGYRTYFTEAPGPAAHTEPARHAQPVPTPSRPGGKDDSGGWLILAGASRIVFTGLLGPGIAFVIAGETLAASVHGIAALLTGN